MAGLIAALIVLVFVGSWHLTLWIAARLQAANALPEGYAIDITESWHDFFQRPYFYVTVTGPDGWHKSGGGPMTTRYAEAERIGRNLIRLRRQEAI